MRSKKLVPRIVIALLCGFFAVSLYIIGTALMIR